MPLPSPAEPTYRIRAAAALSGVKEELIRAWERRYKVLEPQRTPGGYRVYTREDIHVLRRLKQLTEQGISIAEAARLLPQLRAETSRERAPAPSLPPDTLDALAAWQEEVLQAALRHDQAQVEQVLNEAFAVLPALRLFDEFLVPLQRELGERWNNGELSIAQEHLVSQVVRMRLMNVLHAAPAGTRGHVLAACFPDEQHEVGLLGAAVRLRHAGYRVTVLGARVPATELQQVVRAVKPDQVALSCVFDPGRAGFRQSLAAAVRAVGRGIPVIVGGRAAEAHGVVVRESGARLVATAQDWGTWLA